MEPAALDPASPGTECSSSPSADRREEAVAEAVRSRWLGRADYVATWRDMQAFTEARGSGTRDEIWLVEHPPVYTLGLAGRREHLLREIGIEVVATDRGGQVTYHGPGQLVAYLLVDLRRRRLGVRELVRRIEVAVIDLLGSFGIPAYGRVDAPGVYVRTRGCEAKIAALGLRIRNGCSYHGLALNVAMDLSPFSAIDPCGFPGMAVTQLADFGVTEDLARVGERLVPRLVNQLRGSHSNGNS